MDYEQIARDNHRGGRNCAQSVTAAFAQRVGLSPADALQAAPRPRSEGGKCGAYLAGRALLEQMNPEAAAEFERRFLAENGALECGKLRRTGVSCNDLVGCAARLTEELSR